MDVLALSAVPRDLHLHVGDASVITPAAIAVVCNSLPISLSTHALLLARRVSAPDMRFRLHAIAHISFAVLSIVAGIGAACRGMWSRDGVTVPALWLLALGASFACAFPLWFRRYGPMTAGERFAIPSGASRDRTALSWPRPIMVRMRTARWLWGLAAVAGMVALAAPVYRGLVVS